MVGGVRRGHPDVAEMARAAAHVREQLCLVVAAGPEEVVRTLAADALGLEGQGALESLQLKREKKVLKENWSEEDKKTGVAQENKRGERMKQRKIQTT